MNITGYDPEDAKELLKLHSKNDSGMYEPRIPQTSFRHCA